MDFLVVHDQSVHGFHLMVVCESPPGAIDVLQEGLAENASTDPLPSFQYTYSATFLPHRCLHTAGSSSLDSGVSYSCTHFTCGN